MASGSSGLHNVAMAPQIREATTDDWSGIWPIVREVVLAGDTFAYSPEMTDDEARELWMVAAPGRTTVAVDSDAVLGTANMYANRAGPGAIPNPRASSSRSRSNSLVLPFVVLVLDGMTISFVHAHTLPGTDPVRA
jgi:hypothetical protein